MIYLQNASKEYFSCAGRFSNVYKYSILTNNPVRDILLFSLLYRCGNRGTKRTDDSLPGGRAGVQMRPRPCTLRTGGERWHENRLNGKAGDLVLKGIPVAKTHTGGLREGVGSGDCGAPPPATESSFLSCCYYSS